MPDARDLPIPGAHAGSDPRSARPAPRLTGESAQSRADAEQSLAHDDQALSDADQTRSDSDQARADADQLASDRDQAISDRHLANGGDPVAHAFSRDIRQRATRQRKQTSRARLLAATQRDDISDIRDLAGRVRDRAADRRDQAIRRVAATDGHSILTGELHERVSATPQCIAELRRAVVSLAAHGGATDRQRQDIALCVSETLNNVVTHAYRDNAHGLVAVHAALSADVLEIVVIDDGVGLPAPERRPLAGLGLALIARAADHLELGEVSPGTRVRMLFTIG